MSPNRTFKSQTGVLSSKPGSGKSEKAGKPKVQEPGLNLCRKVGNAELRPVVSFDKTVTILS